MDPILGKRINQIVKASVDQKLKLGKIITEQLEANKKLRDKRKKRLLLLELNILTWNFILIRLEKELSMLPKCD